LAGSATPNHIGFVLSRFPVGVSTTKQSAAAAATVSADATSPTE
jgi:hypothetical protein